MVFSKFCCMDMSYLRENWSGVKASAPTLEKKRHHKFFLRFSYTEEVSLSKDEVMSRLLSVGSWYSTWMRFVH